MIGFINSQVNFIVSIHYCVLKEIKIGFRQKKTNNTAIDENVFECSNHQHSSLLVTAQTQSRKADTRTNTDGREVSHCGPYQEARPTNSQTPWLLHTNGPPSSYWHRAVSWLAEFHVQTCTAEL